MVLHIIAYSEEKDVYVDLFFESVAMARHCNPGLKDFRVIGNA